MLRSRPFRRRGFTLPEVLVTMGVLAILGTAIAHMTIFISRSQAVTTARLAAVNRAQTLDREMISFAARAQVAVVYSNFAQWGYTLDSLPDGNINALQQTVHLGPGDSGNYLVMVELWDEADYLSTQTEIADALADEFPPPVRRITGIYLGPPTWLNTDGTQASTPPERAPVRRFELEFSATQGEIGGSSGQILEDLLPTLSEIADHEVIGFVNAAAATSNPLFRLENFDTISIDLPITIRDSDESASFRFQTTLRFTNR